jgi:hypothetical protein
VGATLFGEAFYAPSGVYLMSTEALQKLANYDDEHNSQAPILFRDFRHGLFTMNKSYLIKKEDIEAASITRKPNSISCIEALKFRWDKCLYNPDGTRKEKADIQGCKTPLREFVRQHGLELYLDMSEVIDVRMPLNKENLL